MEQEISKLVLGIRNNHGWLSYIQEYLGQDFADRCAMYDDALIEGEILCRKFYYEQELPKIRTNLKDWIAEMDDFRKECQARRTKTLSALIDKSKNKLAEMLEHRGNTAKKKIMLAHIKSLEKELKSGITFDNIQRAREYPIENLIHCEKNKLALCINHNEKKPSMNCKNNFVYCHACGFHADTIGVYMKINNCGFREAVIKLCNI